MRIFKSEFTYAQIFLLLIIFLFVLFVPGADVYSHTHAAWLYNYMIKNKVILNEDFSMLSGHQPLYGRGAPSYALAGFGWFVFGRHVIKALELLSLIGIIWLSFRLFKNKEALFFWYGLIFIKILTFDAYPYFLSMFLFYLGIYLIKKFNKKPFGDFAIIMAGINHPYIALTNLATIFFGRTLLFLINIVILIAHIFILKYVFFSGILNFDSNATNVIFANLFDITIRSVVLLFPFLVEFMQKFSVRIFNLKTAYCLTIAGAFLIYSTFATPEKIGLQERMKCYYKQNYLEIPVLSGNIRIVDSCEKWMYVSPLKGLVLSVSNEGHGQYYFSKWTLKKYMEYLNKSNTSYVIFCKNCRVTTRTLQDTGELNILKENFPVYADLRDYTIFDVKTVNGEVTVPNALTPS